MFCVRIVLLRDQEQEDEFHKVAVSPIDAVRDHSYRDNRLECHQRHRMRDGQDIIEIGLASILSFPECLPKTRQEHTGLLQAFQPCYSAVLPLLADAPNSKNDSYRITGSFPNDRCFRNGWLQSAAGQDPYPAESPTKTGTVFVFLQQVICDFVGLVDDTRV